MDPRNTGRFYTICLRSPTVRDHLFDILSEEAGKAFVGILYPDFKDAVAEMRDRLFCLIEKHRAGRFIWLQTDKFIGGTSMRTALSMWWWRSLSKVHLKCLCFLWRDKYPAGTVVRVSPNREAIIKVPRREKELFDIAYHCVPWRLMQFLQIRDQRIRQQLSHLVLPGSEFTSNDEFGRYLHRIIWNYPYCALVRTSSFRDYYFLTPQSCYHIHSSVSRPTVRWLSERTALSVGYIQALRKAKTEKDYIAITLEYNFNNPRL